MNEKDSTIHQQKTETVPPTISRDVENMTESGEMEFITPKITKDYQVLAALASTGAGFEALGGSSLMLTEPVENSVDSIIKANKKGLKLKGKIRVLIDKTSEQVIVLDNGLGFLDPRHICERPFDSLKKYDPDLTGKFARGLQGFRSYCNHLVFITRRLEIPSGETFCGKSGRTVKLEFSADSIEIGASIVPDDEFLQWTQGEFYHGAIATYGNWETGEFKKIRKDKLIKRIERHFGELIRKGEIEILAWEGEGLISSKMPSRKDFYQCQPRDYSGLSKISLPSIDYVENGTKKGAIIFELYLTSRAKRNRESLPFLMYKDRPVGDAPIAEIAEFADTDVWNSSYLAGFIRADFCEINELRLALKPGPVRDFLYQEMESVEPFLRNEIKKHHRGLIDLKRSQEINLLVNKLQSFLKQKHIFDFKIAKELGDLTLSEKTDQVIVSASTGADSSHAAITQDGEPSIGLRPISVLPQENVLPGEQQGILQHQYQSGGAGNGSTEKVTGGPDGAGQVVERGNSGYKENADGLNKSLPTSENTSTGEPSGATGRKVRKRKPRGFNISLQDDEFCDELSYFDPVNSTIIINSGHERYRKRDRPEDPINKELFSYISELYIWEICKLVAKSNPDMNITDAFLKTKYEFFETEGK